MVGVVAAIGEEAGDRTGPREKGAGNADVADVVDVGSQQQDTWPALAIAQRVEFAGLAATRLAERLEVGPPFAPRAGR